MKPALVAPMTVALLLALTPPDVIIAPDVVTFSARDVEPPAAPFIDLALLWVSTTVDWQPTRQLVTPEEVRSDAFLWSRMFFRDWDRLPEPLRGEGLTAMVGRFGRLTEAPSRWERMSARDWDRVPQPIRAMAFMNMVRRWACHYHLGERQGVDAEEAAARAKAILMAESWFEHRAASVNADGTRDVGLSQLNDYARRVIRLHGLHGWADFTLEDEDCFDPLCATRALTYWFGLMLSEASGDLDLATRAYNVGIAAARRGGGEEYLQNVRRVMERYVLNRGPGPSWRFVFELSPGHRRPCPRPLPEAANAQGHVSALQGRRVERWRAS